MLLWFCPNAHMGPSGAEALVIPATRSDQCPLTPNPPSALTQKISLPPPPTQPLPLELILGSQLGKKLVYNGYQFYVLGLLTCA